MTGTGPPANQWLDQRAAGSANAARMRRESRRRRGDAIVTLEVVSDVIADLIALGWLPETDHGDKRAIARALNDLVERAIWAHVSPSTGSQGQICFTCDLKGTTVDALISLGWLQADRAGDVDAIAKAFRSFVGRALDLARHGALDLWNVRRRLF